MAWCRGRYHREKGAVDVDKVEGVSAVVAGEVEGSSGEEGGDVGRSFGDYVAQVTVETLGEV